MKLANASRLDRKSGVRCGEHGAPVQGSGLFSPWWSAARFNETADPSAPPDLLSIVAASVNCMWFSLGRTTCVVAGENCEVGNPGTLGMTKERETFQLKVVSGAKAFFIALDWATGP
jgi:hypothetical protein